MEVALLEAIALVANPDNANKRIIAIPAVPIRIFFFSLNFLQPSSQGGTEHFGIIYLRISKGQ
jgi:hypothetical protein